MKLIEIPQELLVTILKYLEVKDLGKIASVCTFLRDISSQNSIWKDKLQSFSNIGQVSTPHKKLVKIFNLLMNNKKNPGFFGGYCAGHADVKELVLKSPQLKDGLSESTIKEITENNNFMRS